MTQPYAVQLVAELFKFGRDGHRKILSAELEKFGHKRAMSSLTPTTPRAVPLLGITPGGFRVCYHSLLPKPALAKESESCSSSRGSLSVS